MRAVTWHYFTNGDEARVFHAGEITQQLPVNGAVPVPDGVVLKEAQTWCPYARECSSHPKPSIYLPQLCHFQGRPGPSPPRATSPAPLMTAWADGGRPALAGTGWLQGERSRKRRRVVLSAHQAGSEGPAVLPPPDARPAGHTTLPFVSALEGELPGPGAL